MVGRIDGWKEGIKEKILDFLKMHILNKLTTSKYTKKLCSMKE